MKKLLPLVLLAQIGIAQADECRINGVYPPELVALTGLTVGGFTWDSSLSPPAGFFGDAPSPNGGFNCEGKNTSPGPDHPVALVHNSLSTDSAWAIRTLDISPSAPLDSNGFPYWSLQFSDAGNTSLGVLTATLFPGLQKLAVSLTVQTPNQTPVVTTVEVPYTVAPLCADLALNLSAVNLLTQARTIKVTAGCGGNVIFSKSNLRVPASLVPRTVRFGKLSADRGPAGVFRFEIVRDPNASPNLAGAR